MLQGIDVSVWQSDIDWQAVKDDGIKFAMIRAGYGANAVDKKFHRNISECNRVGIPCGVYWFSYATSVDEVKREAMYCLEAIKDYKVDYPVCYDLEYDTVRYAKGKGVTIDKAMATSFVKAFCDTIEAAGYIPAVYTNKDYYVNMLEMSELSKYDLWYAWYSKKLDETKGVDIWQFTSEGRVAGVSTQVDCNYSIKDYMGADKIDEEVESLLGKKADSQGRELDNTPTGYALSAVKKAVDKGVIKGNEIGNLMLHSPVTRQDFFVFLDRLGLV